ncbi:MAG: helix-turn-helix domain-containing protein [Ignavibacteriales bacterium]|nr:helix-turn-helix domain-containing protein [Ignavibacteriales bacterium]
MSDVDVIKSIGEKLRSARRARNQSLEGIAGITRINKKFLEDIEEGITPDLPSAYIRAFIRDYAIEVGISPSELLEEYLALSVKGAEDTSRRATTFLNSQFKPTVLDEKIGTTPTKHLPILLILISVIAVGLMIQRPQV